MSVSSSQYQSCDPQRDKIFLIMLSPGQALNLKRMLPKKYSCQPDFAKLTKTRSKATNYCKQLTELFEQARMQAAAVDASSDNSASKSKDHDGQPLSSEKAPPEAIQCSSREKRIHASMPNSKKEEVGSCRNQICSFLTQLQQKKNLLKHYADGFQNLREALDSRPHYNLQDFHSDMIAILNRQESPHSRAHKTAHSALSKTYETWKQNMDKNVMAATSSGVQTEKRSGEVGNGLEEIIKHEGDSDEGLTGIAHAEAQNHKRAPPDYRDNFAQRNTVSKRFCNSARQPKPAPPPSKTRPQLPKQPIKPPETVADTNLPSKTSKTTSFSLASSVLKKYSQLSSSEQQALSQIAKQCRLPTIDIKTIKNSPRVNIQAFLQAIEDLLEKKGVRAADHDKKSYSEEYLESSFEIEDED